MNARLAAVAVMSLCGLAAAQVPAGPGRSGRAEEVASETARWPVRVSADGRHLEGGGGRPFFWLGDTAWLLFQMTTREEAELYFRTRARQGFTVIQAAVVMGEERVGGTLRANVYGDQAFLGGNPASPMLTPGSESGRPDQYDYWDHVDHIVQQAAIHRLTLGLLPLFIGKRGDGYRHLTPDRAYEYGLFLGRRYRSQPHVVWILGGDHTPDTPAKQSVWHDLARGLTVGVAGREDYSRTLITYHIDGNYSSSQWFHDASWLDFNMVQVWGNEPLIYPQITRDYALLPAKPTGLGEGSYEDGPTYPTTPIDALKVRRQAYWSYLAGGYHTYGNTNTWNFGSYRPEVTEDWIAALESPGAAHLSVAAAVFGSLEWWTLVPDPLLIAGGAGSAARRNVAARSSSGSLAVAYLASPATIRLRLDRLSAGDTALATWIDPQTGARGVVERAATSGIASFTPPDGWLDALLLLEVPAPP